MATTITVLSWNVESLGDGKATLSGVTPPQQSEIVNFMSLVIRRSGADLVGIMEVKSGRGPLILQWLLASLNNARPGAAPFAYTWRGRVSSRQDGGTQEEYLYLWKDQPNRLTLDPAGVPGPTSLVGVVDAGAMETLFATTGWTPTQQNAFFGALAASGYIQHGMYKVGTKPLTTSTWRVVPSMWNTINTTTNASVAFASGQNPPTALTSTQLQALATQLKNIDILRFISNADRSPYLGNFLVGNPAKRLMVSMLHAPGPQDRTRFEANNIIALSLPMRAQVGQDNLLVMGDFNISAATASKTARAYGRFTNSQGAFVFASLTPVQLVQVFAPLTGAPLNAADLLGTAETSLTKEYLADTALPTDPLNNPYDKFFFKGSATASRQITSGNAAVLNVIQTMAANQGTAFAAAIGTSALTFFRAFRGGTYFNSALGNLQKAQTKAQGVLNQANSRLQGVRTAIYNAGGSAAPGSALRKRLNKAQDDVADATAKLNAATASVANIQAVITLVTTATVATPQGIGSGLAVYRHAVSDHLPITVQLTA